MRRLLTTAAMLTLLLASPAPPAVSPAMAQYAPSGAPSTPGAAGSQERDRARSRFRYLMLGYGVIWVSLGFFLFDLNRKVAHVGRDIDELKGRLDMVQGPKGR